MLVVLGFGLGSSSDPRHIGHKFLLRSDIRRQERWYAWPHGVSVVFLSPLLSVSRQTEHVKKDEDVVWFSGAMGAMGVVEAWCSH